MPFTVEDLQDRVVFANDALSFTFKLHEGRFTIGRARGEATPAIENATAQAVYRSGLRSVAVRMDDTGRIVWTGAAGQDPHGTGYHAPVLLDRRGHAPGSYGGDVRQAPVRAVAPDVHA